MKIFPAIDIKDNKCVRLTQGDFNKSKIYGDDPYEVALTWEKEGAEFIHLVDLNGASDDEFTNKDIIKKIIKKIEIPIQVGGGIRSKERIRELLEIGVNRVILGTVAIEQKDLVKELINKYGEKISVSIDAKNGKVATRGWKFISEVDSISLCKELEKMGVQNIIYTDISRDGMLTGPNFDIYKEILKNTKVNLIASGGISSLEDIKILKEIGVYGAIIGKALYERKVDLKEVIKCSQKE